MADGRVSPVLHTPIAFVHPGARRTRPFLTMLQGPHPGRVFSLSAPDVSIGRGSDCAILVDDVAVSRKHACVRLLPDEQSWLLDLGSTNGTFVGSERVTAARLCAGDRVQIGPNVSFRFGVADQLEIDLQRRLYESSTFDALTGVLNRASIFRRLEAEVNPARARVSPLSLSMIDVDHFKRINDTEGHAAGDEVLRRLGELFASCVRGLDIIGRYGGEEFVILSRGARLSDGVAIAERLRAAVERELSPITVSIGVASSAELDSSDPKALVGLADRRVYLAKSAGRNRVVGTGGER